MPLYESKVKVRGNSVQTVEIQARNRDEALAHVSRMGRVVTFRRKIGFDLSRGLTAPDRQIFFNRLSSMLASKVGTSDALALIRDTFTGQIQEVAARTLRYVEMGDDLAQAFERLGNHDIPDATVALIKAGSRSGKTWKAVKDAAEFENQLHSIKKTASRGLWTGIGAFVGAGILTVVSTLYVGPQILDSTLIKAANQNGAVNIDFINTTAYLTGYLMAAILVMGVLFWLLASVGRRIMPVQADTLILKVPFYKDLVLSRNNFVVLYGLSLLIKSGVRTEEALRLSAEGAPKGALQHDLTMAAQQVKTGRPWPKAMRTLHPTDKAALLSATDREQVAATLDNLANQYRELYAQRLSSFVPMVNLMAAVFLSIAGGLIFGQTVLPMLQATKGLL